MEAMVELENLSKHFGHFVAVNDVSLSVTKGEVLGFLGPNGAGKSTTMRMIAGFLTPTLGKVRVCGNDVVADPVSVKSAIGYMAEGSPSYEDMTVNSFLNFISEVRGIPERAREERIQEVISKIALESVVDRPIEVLSKGYKRRVGLAQAIMHDPPVLILDEPTDGLDPNQKHQVRSLIQEMSSDKAIIISTHILEEVEAVCTRAVIIGAGTLLADGTSDDLLSRLPNHNAVCIVASTNNVESLRNVLRGVNGVQEIDQQSSNIDGYVRLRCYPAKGADILGAVSTAILSSGLSIRELYQDRGNLDSVFRQITEAEGA